MPTQSNIISGQCNIAPNYASSHCNSFVMDVMPYCHILNALSMIHMSVQP